MEKMLSVKAAADRLGKNRHTVARWIDKGKIPASLIGSRYYVSVIVVEKIVSGTYRNVPKQATSSQQTV